MTFGITRPEKLTVGVPSGAMPVLLVEQDQTRNDDTDHNYTLLAQSLSATSSCHRAPGSIAKFCIGLVADDTEGTHIVASDAADRLTPLLPTCVCSTRRQQFRSTSKAQRRPRVAPCGVDADSDGYDNAIDCSPYS